MQFVSILIFIYFLIKSISYSLFEIKNNKNKIGGTSCLILSIISFIIAIIGIISLYGQSIIPQTFIL